MKKLLSLILLAFGVIFLTGCASVNEYVVINDKGNVLRDIQINVEKNDNKIASALAHDEIYKRGEKKGFKVTHKLKDDGSTLYSLKKVSKPDADGKVTIPYDLTSSNKSQALTIEQSKGFFKDTYKASSKFSISALKEFKNVEYNLTIVLPVEANGKRNSTAKPQDNVLVWKANDKKVVDTQFNVTSINHHNILILLGAAIVIIACVLVAIFIKRRKSSTELDNHENNGIDSVEEDKNIQQAIEESIPTEEAYFEKKVEETDLLIDDHIKKVEPIISDKAKISHVINENTISQNNELQKQSIYSIKPESFKLNDKEPKQEIKAKPKRIYGTTAHKTTPKTIQRKQKPADNDLIHRRLPMKRKRR